MITDDDGKLKICVANDTLRNANIKYTVKDAESGEILSQGVFSAKANSSEKIGNIDYVGKTRLLSIDWEGDVCGKNHYLDILESSNKISRQEYTTLLENSGLYTQWTEKIKQWQ